MATALAIEQVNIPDDEAPADDYTNVMGDFDPDYPGSTAEAPYGYKANGDPYTRRPKGSAKGPRKAAANLPSTDKQARTAAALLARMNGFVGMGLAIFGMPMTAASMAEANSTFEEMAYQALLHDPALCKKILSTGATSGKGGLILAYSMLAVNMFPSAREEISAKRAESYSE